MYHVTVTREQVEARDVSPITDLIAAREAETNNQPEAQNLTFSFDGFEGESRQPFEIPELRAWFQALDEQVPHFLYFLAPQGPLHGLYAACVLSPQWDDAAKTVAFVIPELQEFVGVRLNAIAFYCWGKHLDPNPAAASIGQIYGFAIDPVKFFEPLLSALEQQVADMAQAQGIAPEYVEPGHVHGPDCGHNVPSGNGEPKPGGQGH